VKWSYYRFTEIRLFAEKEDKGIKKNCMIKERINNAAFEQKWQVA